VGGGAGFILPAPGVHQHRVEPARYQACEHTFALRLQHCLVLQKGVVVFDEHLIQVKVAGSMTPVNLQVVIPSTVGRRGALHLRWL